MKVCERCKESKPISEFHKNKSRKDGLMGMCKECNSARMKKWHAENYSGERSRARTIKRHGLTQERFDAMIAEQGGTCATCTRVPDVFHIDHSHECCEGDYSCGKCVRGLLCSQCNTALGLVGENPDILRAMIAYMGA